MTDLQQIDLEILITLRESMIIRNRINESRGFEHHYSAEDFLKLAEYIDRLKTYPLPTNFIECFKNGLI